MRTSTITWIDSITPGVFSIKVYRDDVLKATVNLGVETWTDNFAVEGATYKYEVQAISAGGESTAEVLDVNVKYVTIPSDLPNTPTGIQLSEYEIVEIPNTPTGIQLSEYEIVEDLQIPTGITLTEI